MYIINFLTYLTNEPQTYTDSFKLRKDAEVVAKQLRACGHTHVKVVKVSVK